MQAAEALTAQLAKLEPLRTSKDGPKHYRSLRTLQSALNRVMAGPWTTEELERVGGLEVANPPKAREIPPELAEAEKVVAEARAEFERSDGLWAQASTALLKLQSQGGRYNSWGEPAEVPERLQRQIALAAEEQRAARFFRDEALDKLTAATVARNGIDYSLAQKRRLAEYHAEQAQQTQANAENEQRRRAALATSLDRLRERAIS